MRPIILRSTTVVMPKSNPKTAMMAATDTTAETNGCQLAGKNPTSQCASDTKSWSQNSVMDQRPPGRRRRGRRRWSAVNAFPLNCGDRCGLGRWWSSRLRCRGLGFGFRVRLGLRLRFGFFGGETLIHLSGFSGVNLVVGLVRFGQLMLVEKQTAESVCIAQLEFGVHLDGLERTDF